MTINVQAVKFTMDDLQKELVYKKFERITYAEELITNITCKIKHDKKFIFECTIHFKGGSAHVSADGHDFEEGLNKFMDTVDQKVRKEKEKMQEKK